MPADFSDKKILEKYSSAFTLSDMEIFIFPELFFPLILANIVSPIIWQWRDDPWFRDIGKRSFNSKVNRIKQYIIQNYVFNLDLATWGLTTKEKEISRFSDFFDVKTLRHSNALFGYEGDKYYFDIDIRKHFGLDKYNSDIIPYWKTETIEAMTAFRFKESFTTGAGECVSLSALYAAALFIIGRVPLEEIYMIATPLHSQNFITEKEGLITNNRRIVTKNMWYNGTSLSSKARRAMENERITIVSHITGYIHSLFNKATISKESYLLFSDKLKKFLKTDLNSLVFTNFLRFKNKYKILFQYRCEFSGKQRYISVDKMFEYEHTSRFNASPKTRCELIKEIEGDEFHLSPIQGKIMLNNIEDILNNNRGKSLEMIEEMIIRDSDAVHSDLIHDMMSEISHFIRTEPRLPDPDKEYSNEKRLVITRKNSREEIMDMIHGSRDTSELSELTLYVYRQMDKINWLPFIKAAMERNPVSFGDLDNMKLTEVYALLRKLPDASIYDGVRMALPDEVWNFRRGDGIEKALLMAGFIVHKDKQAEISIEIDKEKVLVTYRGDRFIYNSDKKFRKSITIKGSDYSVINQT